MYYSTKIAPECANAARELAQHMASPTEPHWKAMDRFIGYLKGKEQHQFVYNRPRELRVIAFADSNYATSPDDRKSISGCVTTIDGTTTHWSSKKQGAVTLSSTEAEYVAISTVCQEVKFQQMLLDELLQCAKPGIIFEDNTGCIFLVNNQQVGQRTKHIDTRHHFIRDEIKNKTIVIKFVKSEDNIADCMTKNLSEGPFVKFKINLLNGRVEFKGPLREDDEMWNSAVIDDSPGATQRTEQRTQRSTSEISSTDGWMTVQRKRQHRYASGLRRESHGKLK